MHHKRLQKKWLICSSLSISVWMIGKQYFAWGKLNLTLKNQHFSTNVSGVLQVHVNNVALYAAIQKNLSKRPLTVLWPYRVITSAKLHRTWHTNSSTELFPSVAKSPWSVVSNVTSRSFHLTRNMKWTINGTWSTLKQLVCSWVTQENGSFGSSYCCGDLFVLRNGFWKRSCSLW